VIKVSDLVKNIGLVLSLIDHAVKVAETETASGEQKRKAAITMVLNLAKLVGLDLTRYEDLIGKMIDTAVFVYNLLGVFVHHNNSKS
jgi:hypothetical protein